jgi:MscS family membrane protein
MMRSVLTGLGAVLFICTLVSAQEPNAGSTAQESTGALAAPTELASPAATLKTFLRAMRSEPVDEATAVRCLDTNGLAKSPAELANRLYRCIIRIEWPDFRSDESLLDVNDLTTPELAGLQEWRFFPREYPQPVLYRDVVVQRERDRRIDMINAALAAQSLSSAHITLVRAPDGAWRFSTDTLRSIDDFWEAVRRAHIDPVKEAEGADSVTLSDRIEAMWPVYFTDNDFLGVKYWQWLSLALLILLGLVIDLIIRIVLSRLFRKIMAKRGGEAQPATVRRTVRPFGLAIAAVFWLLTLDVLGLPETAYMVLVAAARLFAMVAVVWAAFRLTDMIAEFFATRAARTETKFDDLLIPLIRKTIKIFVMVFGVIYIADSLQMPIAPLLTGLGIGGAGLAFAAKDTIEHFFGSVTVIADRPFHVGDWVVIDDVEGTVEEVGLRSSRIRTFYNSLVTIPNGNLVRAVVDNYGRRKYRRWKTHISLTYGTSPEKIDAFCEGIREFIRLHPYTRKDYYQVWLHQFGPHSLDVLVYVFHHVPDWQTELRERHRLMLDIMRLADQIGVDFAFPTQTLHLTKAELDLVEGDAVPEKNADTRAKRKGRHAARQVTSNAPWRDHDLGRYTFQMASDTEKEDEEDDTQIESKIGGDG